MILPSTLPANDRRQADTTHRQSKRTFWKVLATACEAAVSVHVVFGALFASLGSWAKLHDSVQPDDEVARRGGEAFVTLLSRTASVDAVAIAERACRSVPALALALDGSPVASRTTLTFAVATLQPGEAAQARVARADSALYRGKAAGRNRAMCAA